jgi:lysozyme family protein
LKTDRVLNSEIIKKVLVREGGSKISRDPDDPGGVTKYGISKRSNPDVDIENLTEEGAILIYFEKYWTPSKASRLPKSLQDMYFDMVVNFGQRRAVKILQEACNNKAKRKNKKIVVDGRIGPKTIGATKYLEKDRLLAFRVMHYSKLCEKNKGLMKYYYGWIRRTISI